MVFTWMVQCGGAGHSEEIVKRLSDNGLLIGIDRDEDALNSAKKRLYNYNNVKYIHGNHDEIREILEKLGIDKVDGILLDLGVSSYQLDEKSRGFSYMQDAKLDMRMDTSQKLTAEDVVNDYSEEDLTKIFSEYGEEKFSNSIARNICKVRQEKRIETTEQLVDIIRNSIPISKQKDGHPAKRTFQALRIEVNDEIKPLYNTVLNSIKLLKENGRIAIITFHSLEDRAVKEAFIEAQGRCTCPKDLPYCICNYISYGRIITKKPIVPSEEEQKENSRSKSAKWRIFERKEKVK